MPRGMVAAVLTEGLFGRLAFGMVSFGLPLYALALGLDLMTIGLVIGLRSLVVIPAKPLAGWLADRIGLRAVYLLSGGLRVVAALALIVAADAFGLLVVRVLQGLSAAGRDVGSLGVIARDADGRVGSVYGWYTTAKHVGGVAGAAGAGLILAGSGGAFLPLFTIVVVLSTVPLLTSWLGVATGPPAATAPLDATPQVADGSDEGATASPQARRVSVPGAALMAGMVAGAAYMVHGLFPVLATEYAGLSSAEAGLLYSLSAAVLLVCGPLFGWLTDRFGTWTGLTWRPLANIGSSLLYLAPPGLLSIALARAVDDSGKAAFRPAWAALATSIAAGDPRRRGQRLGTLDTAQTIGEAAGPALAGVLWQSGGIVLLFGVRIVLAILGEVIAWRVLGEWGDARARSRRLLRGALGPLLAVWLPSMAGIAIAAGLVAASSVAALGQGTPGPVLAGLVAVAGCLAGGAAGLIVSVRRERAEREHLANVRHELRQPLAVVRGEVELLLARADLPAGDRATSVASALGALERATNVATLGIRSPADRTAALPRECDPEGGTLAGPIVDARGSAVSLRDGAHDGETEPGARLPA